MKAQEHLKRKDRNQCKDYHMIIIIIDLFGCENSNK